MKQTMKAVVVRDKNDVAVRNDIPMPQIGEYEALVKMYSCGFCNGTDFHVIDGSLTKEEGLGAYPTILGHEGCGDIVAVGAKVRHLHMGDRLIHPVNRPCGDYSMTYGNMCEYALVPDHLAMLEDGWSKDQLPFNGNTIIGVEPNFVKIPKHIDPIDGGVLLSLCECLGAVRDFGIGEGASVMVYGCGPMGLASMYIMRALGVKRIVAVDSIDSRLATAKNEVGVDQTINFERTAVSVALAGEKFDFTYDAVGAVSIIEESSHYLRQGGKVCALGVLGAGRDLLNMHKLQNNTSVHIHSQPYKRFGFMAELVALIEAGKINPKNFYSHVLPMEDIHQAMELVKNKQCLKVILKIAD